MDRANVTIASAAHCNNPMAWIVPAVKVACL